MKSNPVNLQTRTPSLKPSRLMVYRNRSALIFWNSSEPKTSQATRSPSPRLFLENRHDSQSGRSQAAFAMPVLRQACIGPGIFRMTLVGCFLKILVAHTSAPSNTHTLGLAGRLVPVYTKDCGHVTTKFRNCSSVTGYGSRHLRWTSRRRN